MASTISAGTTSGTAIAITGDTSGSLALLTNNGTTAVTIDTSQRVAFVAGTAALPAITTTGDTDTGVWFPAANTVATSTSGTEAMRIDSSGNLLVGNTTADVIGTGANGLSYRASIGNLSVLAASANALNVGRATSTGTMVFFYYNAVAKGSISTDGSNVAYNTSSDYRLKENIVDLPNALTVISQLKPRKFDWKETKETATGFIAHELAEVMPQAVTGEKDAVETVDIKDEEGKVIGQEEKPVYQGIDTSFLVATLTASIQELKAIVDALQADVQALKATPLPAENT